MEVSWAQSDEPVNCYLVQLCDPEVDSCVLPPTQESNTSSCMGPVSVLTGPVPGSIFDCVSKDESLSSSQSSIEDGGNCRLESLFSQVRHPV